MTDRYIALTVVLEKSMRQDDADELISAIKRLRGVASVIGNVEDPSMSIAVEKAKHEIRMQIIHLIV